MIGFALYSAWDRRTGGSIVVCKNTYVPSGRQMKWNKTLCKLSRNKSSTEKFSMEKLVYLGIQKPPYSFKNFLNHLIYKLKFALTMVAVGI